MFRVLLLSLLLFSVKETSAVNKENSLSSDTTSATVTTTAADTTTVTPPTTASTLTTPDNPSAYCDFFPEPTDPDEGNYGDASCEIGAKFPEEILLERRILTTNDGEKVLREHLAYPNTVISKVVLLNFGRYHGATNSIGIFNDYGVGSVEINVDIFSEKGIRMFAEIYGPPRYG